MKKGSHNSCLSRLSGPTILIRVRTSDFDFVLPPELIAQQPALRREGSRLLVLSRASATIEHRQFSELPDLLVRGDVLVLNDSRVIPARLRGRNANTGGAFEVLLLEETARNEWWAMMKPGKRARIGTQIEFQGAKGNASTVAATVIDTNDEGHRKLRFAGSANILAELDNLGEVPLPPYILRSENGPGAEDRLRYQTVYAQQPGSVAAPTAGLHFSNDLLDRIRENEVTVCFITLHVGLGTFAPVKTETLAAHPMHEERFSVPGGTANIINLAKAERRRVIAVGTTSLRVIESVARENNGRIVEGAGRTRIFLYPPCEFRIADALLTNFHLPRSTLFMLVSAFAAPGKTGGRELALRAYAEAIRERYRFFSFGDAMLIL